MQSTTGATAMKFAAIAGAVLPWQLLLVLSMQLSNQIDAALESSSL